MGCSCASVDGDGSACAGVEVIVAEGFLEAGEGWFAGAVARGDSLHIPFRLEVGNELVDFVFGSVDEVEAAEDNVDAGIYCSGGLQDFFDAGVRAAIDEQEAVRLFDGEGEFRHFEETFALRDRGHEKNSWRDFGQCADQDEISGVIEFSGIEIVGIGAIEVAHFGGQGSVGAEVSGRYGCTAKTVGAIAGNVDGDGGVNFENVFQAGGVIGVAMRDDDEIGVW